MTFRVVGLLWHSLSEHSHCTEWPGQGAIRFAACPVVVVLHRLCEAEPMNSIQIADETFIAADGALVGAAIADQSQWRRWWPDLHLQVTEDRAEKGIRWAVTGALTGTMEIWLEPSLDGVVLHYFLHAEPTGATAWELARMKLAKLTHRRRVAGKKMAFGLKTTLEESRPIGVSSVV
jgi:hypothetical protein